jgi:NAD(P)-dependent dehydrogenase (short-subunit alcohol dehydrogenase family)
MGRLDGKVAVVTGGALGIGRSCCLLMAREGASVVVTDVLETEGKAVVDEILKGDGKAEFHKLDVGDEGNVRAVFEAARKAFGNVTVLVNNAGVSGANKPPHELTEEEWDAVQRVNVKGCFFGTKHAVPQMKAAGGGSIIHMSSIYGLVGAPDAPPYHASKGAVTLMAKTDAMFYAADNIRVNSVHPGFIWTPMVEGFLSTLPDPAAAKKGLESLHALNRMGDPDDIAWACVYLASDESKFVTGSELVVDGGYTAR